MNEGPCGKEEIWQHGEWWKRESVMLVLARHAHAARVVGTREEEHNESDWRPRAAETMEEDEWWPGEPMNRRMMNGGQENL